MTFQRHEPDPKLTFTEQHVWAPLGWFFIEVPVRLPDWTWRFVGAWRYPLGNWFYDRAYDRWELNNLPTPWKDGDGGEGVN